MAYYGWLWVLALFVGYLVIACGLNFFVGGLLACYCLLGCYGDFAF